jgi:hypothetical protein
MESTMKRTIKDLNEQEPQFLSDLISRGLSNEAIEMLCSDDEWFNERSTKFKKEQEETKKGWDALFAHLREQNRDK